MKNIWVLILISLLLVLLFWALSRTEPKHIREARREKKKIKQRIIKEEFLLIQKQQIQKRGAKYYYPLRYLGYPAIIASFFGITYLTQVTFSPLLNWEYTTWLIAIEMGLLLITCYWKKTPIEFTVILAKYDPQLRKLCFGRNRANIEGQINGHKMNIFMLEEQLKKQDAIINEWKENRNMKLAF